MRFTLPVAAACTLSSLSLAQDCAFQSLNNPFSNDSYAIFEYNKAVYDGGWYHFRRDEGGQVGWTSFGGDIGGGTVDTFVKDMIVFEGDLIVGGPLTFAGGLPVGNIARWNGNFYSAMGDGFGAGEVETLDVYDGKVVAAGSIRAGGLGNPINRIAMFDNDSGQWQGIGGGMTGSGGPGFGVEVWDVVVYQGELIATGRFEFAGNTRVDGVARWDGTQWHPMGRLSYGAGNLGIGTALAVHDGALFLSGFFTKIEGQDIVWMAQWTGGTSWLPVGSAPSRHSLSMASFKGQLYAAGPAGFTIDGTQYDFARWNGAQWEGIADADGLIIDISPTEDRLLISGTFSQMNGVHYGNLVELRCEDNPCEPDFTGDGQLDFFDVSAFITAFNAMDPAADFTGDGQFNFFDISSFITAFNAGCP